MAKDVIKARRIELTDAQGNLRLVLDGGEDSEDGDPGVIVYGPDGPVSGAAMKVGWESGRPFVYLSTVGGGLVLVTIDEEGKSLIHMRGEDGAEGSFSPKREDN